MNHCLFMSCIYLEILSKIYISIAVYRKVRIKQRKKTKKKKTNYNGQYLWWTKNIRKQLSSFIYLENWNCKKMCFLIKMWNGGCD